VKYCHRIASVITAQQQQQLKSKSVRRWFNTGMTSRWRRLMISNWCHIKKMSKNICCTYTF